MLCIQDTITDVHFFWLYSILQQAVDFVPLNTGMLAGVKRKEPRFPSSPPPAKRTKKDKRGKTDESESDDEVSTFKARPSASVNRPMILPPVEKVRKQQIELSMAQVDPNASFAERVLQFDNMEAIAKKREFKRNQ